MNSPIPFDAIVTTKKEMIAALLAAAHPTFEAAKANPVCIQWGSTIFTFKNGLTEQRVDKLVANIRKKFKVCYGDA